MTYTPTRSDMWNVTLRCSDGSWRQTNRPSGRTSYPATPLARHPRLLRVPGGGGSGGGGDGGGGGAAGSREWVVQVAHADGLRRFEQEVLRPHQRRQAPVVRKVLVRGDDYGVDVALRPPTHSPPSLVARTVRVSVGRRGWNYGGYATSGALRDGKKSVLYLPHPNGRRPVAFACHNRRPCRSSKNR